MTACTRTKAIKPTFSFGASQLIASFRMQDSSTIINAYSSNSIKNGINALDYRGKVFAQRFYESAARASPDS